ncbi:MAG: hypothetical protein U0989_08250 [Azonexus sp.]|nr:hypothetical protein [Azonexus sp.]
MSNQAFNIMSAAYYDQLCEHKTPAMLVGGFDPDFFRGSFNNPLQTMRLITRDIEGEGDYGCERLAKATGVPANWFSDTRLNAPADEVIRALGVMCKTACKTFQISGVISVQ